MDRTKTSSRFAVGNIATLIKAGGGNLEDFTLSKSTMWSKRNNNRMKEYEKFYADFKAPKHSVIGWDGKVVKTVMGSEKPVEYLAIVLSGAPDITEGKLLEVEEVPDGKGVTDAEATFTVVTSCRAVESLRALLFDTTSSNTGVYKGAAIVLMTKIGRVLLWFECRHHMAELFIKPVWILLFGDDSGPYRSDFSLFKKICPYIEKENLVVLTINPGLEEELKESTVELLTNILIIPNNKSQLPSDNYKEMFELTLRVLGADVPRGFKIRKCGANNKVRFMVDIIYGMKMFLLQNLVVDEEKMEMDQNQIRILTLELNQNGTSVVYKLQKNV